MLHITDSYKLTHHQQDPPNTTNTYSYFESREGASFPETVFCGLQYYLIKYFCQSITPFNNVTPLQKMANMHLGEGFFPGPEFREMLHDRAHLPIRIKAVAEGTPVPTGNVLMTVENTDERYPWITNYVETILTHVWYPSTVASLSRFVKEDLKVWLDMTADSLEGLKFMLHDFGCRGAACPEAAAIGGFGHLVNFLGTDTVPALMLARDIYGSACAGLSIPASEHSTMTKWGKDGEVDAYANMLDIYPTGPVSVVSDSWNFLEAVEKIWCGKLKEKVLARDGVTVIRPDSGDPIEMNLKAAELLRKNFEHTINNKGYVVLNPKVRLIQGDGMDIVSIRNLLAAAAAEGFSAENWVFGMGGGLLQKVNRDTQRFAFKCSSAVIDGERRDVYKQPASDPTKNSKRGRLGLYKNEEGFYTGPEGEDGDLLETVYEDGKLIRRMTLEEIRANAEL